MAVEKERECGYRTQYSLYLVGKFLNFVECDRLPLTIPKCKCCGNEITFNRSIKQINPFKLFGNHEREIVEIHEISITVRGLEPGMTVKGCRDRADFMCMPPESDVHGLMYVGKQYYSVPSFVEEVKEMGFSKKIPFMPKWLKNNESILYLARQDVTDKKGYHPKKGLVKEDVIFMTVLMTGIEYILPETERDNKELMSRLVYNGVTPVFVPDDDPDHLPLKRKRKIHFAEKSDYEETKINMPDLKDLI